MTIEIDGMTLIPVGICPEHDIVKGDDVDVKFPESAECHCGRELDRMTYATPEEAEEAES